MAKDRKWSIRNCEISKYYKSKNVIKCILVWDLLRLVFPMFFFTIALIIFIKEKVNGKTKDGNSLVSGSFLLSPTSIPTGDSNEALTSTAQFLGEIFRTLMISAVGVYAWCKKFEPVPIGSYFWVRVLNSILTLVSHTFLWLVVGANILTLFVTSVFFCFDLYLSYIIYYFWQNLKTPRNIATSSSAISDLQSQEIEGNVFHSQRRRENEEAKVHSWIIFDGNLNLVQEQESRHEEAKDSENSKLPPVYQNKYKASNYEPTKPTGYFDEYKDLAYQNKDLRGDNDASSITRDPKSIAKQVNSSLPTRKTFFTSTHIQMIERSPRDKFDMKSKTQTKSQLKICKRKDIQSERKIENQNWMEYGLKPNEYSLESSEQWSIDLEQQIPTHPGINIAKNSNHIMKVSKSAEKLKRISSGEKGKNK